MLRMAGDPMIETTIAKGNTLNHFNFVIEAPTAVYLQNAKWRLFLDYYSIRVEGQGYVLFISQNIDKGKFVR